MEQILEFLPFLIPLFILQIGLLVYSVYHILKHEHYKRGNRVLWLVIVIVVNFIGPILYLTIGRDNS